MGDKGAFFLTEPLDNHGLEWRCYMRDPDGYLIEVGQYTPMAIDWFNSHIGGIAAKTVLSDQEAEEIIELQAADSGNQGA